MKQKSSIFWNNVCLLSKMEEENNNRCMQQWKEREDYPVEFSYFGLGREQNLYMKLQKAISQEESLPEAIVCTDLTVFQDPRCLLRRLDQFAPLHKDFPVRSDFLEHPMMHPSGSLVPSNIIPLVLVANHAKVEQDQIPRSLEDLLSPQWNGKVVLGGIDTSAGKSVLMSYAYLYGEVGMKTFIDHARFSTVPAQAFQLVKNGTYPIGIVPTIFSAMGSRCGVEQIWPREGAVSIPAYTAIRKDAPEPVRHLLRDCLLNDSLQMIYSQHGQMIPMKPGIPDPQFALENQATLLYPPWEWIEKLDMEAFLNICSMVKMHGAQE